LVRFYIDEFDDAPGHSHLGLQLNGINLDMADPVIMPWQTLARDEKNAVTKRHGLSIIRPLTTTLPVTHLSPTFVVIQLLRLKLISQSVAPSQKPVEDT